MYRPNVFLCTPLLVILLLVAAPNLASAVTALMPGDVLVADQAGFVYHYSAAGADLGVFASGIGVPSWITVDNRGNVYVSGYTDHRVHKFSPTGENVLTIATPFDAGGVAVGHDGTIFVADYFGAVVYHYSASGVDLGLFVVLPLGRADFILLDSIGQLYVTDFTTGTVRQVSPTGDDLGTFVSLAGAVGMALDADGNLYVSSSSSPVIARYSPAGADFGVFASTGLNGPYGLAFDSNGNLLVANYAGRYIRQFSQTGADLGIFASVGLAGPRDVVVVPGPVTKGHCKDEGWRDFEFPRVFKNQGDCIHFVNTGH